MSSSRVAGTLDRDSPLPLWAQLLNDLSARLARGEFVEAFPAEKDVADEYGVSRNTVREAMRRLRADGVIVAERGRRPRLAPPREIEQPLGALYGLFAAVEAAGLDQRSVVRHLDVRRDAAVAARLHLEPAAPLFFLERLRLADGEPLALDQVWLPLSVGWALLDVDFTHTALYTELHRRTGLRLTRGREEIRAVVPSDEERGLLALGPGGAALAVVRVALGRDGPVEWRHSIIRGDRYTLVADFSARDGYQIDLAQVGAHRREGDDLFSSLA